MISITSMKEKGVVDGMVAAYQSVLELPDRLIIRLEEMEEEGEEDDSGRNETE